VTDTPGYAAQCVGLEPPEKRERENYAEKGGIPFLHTSRTSNIAWQRGTCQGGCKLNLRGGVHASTHTH